MTWTLEGTSRSCTSAVGESLLQNMPGDLYCQLMLARVPGCRNRGSRSTRSFPLGLPGYPYQVALRVLVRDFIRDYFDFTSEQLYFRLLASF